MKFIQLKAFKVTNSYFVNRKAEASKALECLLDICCSECFRYTCAIDMGDSVILTGGYYSNVNAKDTEMRMNGSSTELPELITGRHGHGCASYADEYGNKVIITLLHDSLGHNMLPLLYL